MTDIEHFAHAAGLSAFAFHGTLDDIIYELRAGRPVMVGVADASKIADRAHFEIVVACDPGARRFKSLDPARGFVERSYSKFEDEWQFARQLTLVMFSEPTLAKEVLGSAAIAISRGPETESAGADRASHDDWLAHHSFAFAPKHVARR